MQTLPVMDFFTHTVFCTVFEIGNFDLFNAAREYNSFWNGDKTVRKNVSSEQDLMVQLHLCFYSTNAIPWTIKSTISYIVIEINGPISVCILLLGTVQPFTRRLIHAIAKGK